MVSSAQKSLVLIAGVIIAMRAGGFAPHGTMRDMPMDDMPAHRMPMK